MHYVYLSSTFRDLEIYRTEMRDTLTFLNGFFRLVCPMEYMLPGSANPILDQCLGYVEQADIYILVIGKRYGSLPPGLNKSYTEHEYDKACEDENKIIIPLIADENQSTFSGIAVDDPARLSAFKNKVLTRHATFAKTFTNPDHLSKQMLIALYAVTNKKALWSNDIKYYCNRNAQRDDFIAFKEENRLNVFTIICNQHDEPDTFNYRMAKSEFGLNNEYVEKPLRASAITSNYTSYQKHIIRIISHMMDKLIPSLQNRPRTVTDLVAYLAGNHYNNLYIEVKLNKEDAESLLLMQTLQMFLNELYTVCKAHDITMFFVLVFEFPNDEEALESIVQCLGSTLSFEVIMLGKLGKITSQDIKEWVQLYVKNQDPQLISSILNTYFPTLDVCYPMNDMLPKMDEIIARFI